MRLRTVLGLCLPVVLVACSGGFLPTPTPRPTPTATRTPTRALAVVIAGPTATASSTPPAQGSPSPASPLAAGPAPEIAAGLLPAQERDRYLSFVQALRTRDEVAASWLVSSGLLLRDARLDEQEQATLEMILARDKDDPLWYLTHVRVQDGISSQDFAYLKDNDAVPADNWYFEDDMRGLEAFQLLSADGQRSLQRIFERAHQDPEVRKGLYLINTLGLPDSRAFKHPVPAYNVQLHLLARLLEQGVPGEYERAAVAAALTYGSLMTLCDQGARDQVLDYASERLRLLIDTDVLLAASGAHWRSTSYPLEALMVLLWSGQSTAYPQPGVPLAQAPGLRQAFAAQPLTRRDLGRLLVPLDSLRQMQDLMLRVVVEQTADEATAGELVESWWSQHRRDEADEGGPDLGRQWIRYRDGRGFAGGAESAYVLQGLASSINLPLVWAQLWCAHGGQLQKVPYGFRLGPARATLQLSESALRATAALPAQTQAVLVVWRLPWDNWHLDDPARICLTQPLPLSLWRAGIPAGYLLRQGVLAEDAALAALGLKPSPTPTAGPR